MTQKEAQKMRCDAYRAGWLAGAEQMRERAAKCSESNSMWAKGEGGGCSCEDDIRALPLEDES